MPDSRNRVARLRQARRDRGLRETNVWVPAGVQTAIDDAVRKGMFPSRRVAIIHALERVFGETGTSAKQEAHGAPTP